MHMQQIKLHGFVHRVKKKLEQSYSQEAYNRYDMLQKWFTLQAEACFEETIYNVLQVSRATLFR